MALPPDYSFANVSNQTLVRRPDSIQGQVFYLNSLTNCDVYIMDYTSAIYATKLTNCRVYIGPVDGAAHISECTDCIIGIAARQFRLKKCTNMNVFLYAGSQPHIELSKEIHLGPYNFSYPGQTAHFRKSNLNPSINHWTNIYDHDPVVGETHFDMLPPSSCRREVYTIAELGPPENPVMGEFVIGEPDDDVVDDDFIEISVGDGPEMLLPPVKVSGSVSQPSEPIVLSQGPGFNPPPQQFEHGIYSQNIPPVYVTSRPEEDKVINVPRSPPAQPESLEVPGSVMSDGLVLKYYYRKGIGFVPEYTQVHPIPLSVINKTLHSFGRLVAPYNDDMLWKLQAAFGGLISFFMLMLFFVVLKLIAWQVPGGYSFMIIAGLLWLGAIEGFLFKKVRDLKQDSRQHIADFESTQNATNYKQYRATLAASLETLEITFT